MDHPFKRGSLVNILEWKLKKTLTESQWAEVTGVVSVLVNRLSEIRDAQAVAKPLEWVPKWLWKWHQRSVLRLNTPAYQWGMNGQGFDSGSLELMPTPHLQLTLKQKEEQTIHINRWEHHHWFCWDHSLHAYAWVGALLFLSHKNPQDWEIIELSISDAEKNALLEWVSQKLDQEKAN